MYRTGFFGTFALGNKTPDARFDYSYNYISISGSNVNSIIQTISGTNVANNIISSENRLAYSGASLNLSLLLADGYDISVNALSSAIVGISNNILTSANRTFDISNIYYNYNIIPLSSYLVNGNIGLSFEMYRTGFFGAIVLTNNRFSTIDYSYNYVSINSSIIYSTLIPITNSSSNTRTISGEVRLRDATSQIAMNIRTASSEADISYSINGGTINTFVITTISPYKYSNFNILPNVNNLVNGTLIFNLVPERTGWYGTIVIQLLTYMNNNPNIKYRIYKGSSTTTSVLVENQTLMAGSLYSTVSSSPHSFSDRLEQLSSTFLVEIQYVSNGNLYLDNVTNGTGIQLSNPLLISITPGTTQNNTITIKFSISPV